MFRVKAIILSALFIIGCSENNKTLTLEMEKNARQTVVNYLEKNKLPNINLVSFKSEASPAPDFAFLYTGGGRCIEFIVYCYEKTCTELKKYPHDSHGDECP